ncbi:MAG: rkpM [Devosia sp.]|uniref:UDP-4-amino-4, 6-dideoxy-N-acetyl-beta-L-altrosamine transaminase n=1 Tax=Devosia sp. TaxID=1871048 RepID=UPI002603C2DF|nr:UDP-4-amino-4,6-dideoxy-N-acetyl-beta-L-altrosamine transaminase [Devosia sp.]MDB5526928.1 rkpM [Devosia sp.]
MIPYGRQSISEEDIEAVVAVLKSDFLTQGPMVPRFEQAVAGMVGAQHGVAVNSATSALHIACLALGVGPGDLVWTTPNTFVASANCARYCGASVDFVDIDAHSWNMSIPALQAKLVQAEAKGNLPKVLIPVHFSGQPCDMAAIGALARQYGFKVIEDASHAIGATYRDTKIGDCRHSDVVVFSFHPVKIITTGEGGMAMTNDGELAWRMAALRSHGITREPSRLQAENPAPWYYEQQMLGYNYRMIDIEAALGLSQLERLDAFVARRNDLAQRYDRLLANFALILPTVDQECRSSFHLYVVRLPRCDPARHRQVFEALRAGGIGVNLHYMPVHLQPDFRPLGFAPGMFSEAEAYGESAITLPLYPAMTEDDQDRVVDALDHALRL